MAFTEEQEEIIYSYGNVKCIAVAGSGKSTTLFGYARYRLHSRGLYIVYNRSARVDAKLKAKKYELKNLDVHTAHSLAYSVVGKKYRRVNKIPLEGIIGVCKITGSDTTKIYTVAQMILDGLNMRCNKVLDILYEDDFEKYDKDIVKKHFGKINDAVDFIWDEMDSGRLGITDDFYLKKYVTEFNQFHETGNEPTITKKGKIRPRKSDVPYSYVVFDEGQDANEIMLHGFRRQAGDKVIVGDPSQQIYSWRGAVNALYNIDYPTYHLTGSHRFMQDLADKANHVLEWKKLIGTYRNTVLCRGLRTSPAASGPTGYLCRSTVGLFKKMVDVFVINGGPIYIEGGLWNNDFLSNNRLLSNIFWLWSNQRGKIRDPMIKGFKSIAALQEFCKNTGNREIGSLIDLIFNYKGEIFRLKDELIKNLTDDKSEAIAIFSTVHKAKGQEYSHVELDDTFMLYDDIVKLSEAIKIEYAKNKSLSPDMISHIKRVNEEINIRYVAITRGMNSVKL